MYPFELPFKIDLKMHFPLIFLYKFMLYKVFPCRRGVLKQLGLLLPSLLAINSSPCILAGRRGGALWTLPPPTLPTTIPTRPRDRLSWFSAMMGPWRLRTTPWVPRPAFQA